MKISIFILLMKMKTKSPAILGAIFAAIILLFPDALHAQQQTGVSVTAGKEFYITGFSGYHDPKFELKVVVEKNVALQLNTML